jgi:hypothetical protein
MFKAAASPVLLSLQPPDASSAVVTNALRSSLASSKGTKHGSVLGSFLADTLSPLPAAAALLQYTLPNTFDVIPLLVHITGGFVQHKKSEAVALVTVQWHVPRELKQQPAGEGRMTACCLVLIILLSCAMSQLLNLQHDAACCRQVADPAAESTHSSVLRQRRRILSALLKPSELYMLE